MLKNKAKGEGYPNDTDEQLFKFLILQVRKNLKMVLCMSPVGDLLRKRASKFPGIINCCSVDFFHAWPREACEKVAYNFLKDVEFETDELTREVGNFMSEINLSIDKYNRIYHDKFKRICYTTPKSFLELIEFYVSQLSAKREYINK
jgi:dynein heavy chain